MFLKHLVIFVTMLFKRDKILANIPKELLDAYKNHKHIASGKQNKQINDSTYYAPTPVITTSVKSRKKANRKVITLGVAIAVLSTVILYPFLPTMFYAVKGGLVGSSSVKFGQIMPYNDTAYANNGVINGANETSKNYENILIIPKIGVRIKIIDSLNEASALNKGAWRFPYGSSPDKGGNTSLSAHRFKYLPPHSETFYLLDKLEIGDRFTIIWEGKEYNYRVASSKIVSPNAGEVLNPTERPTVTLITCNPVFSIKQRLVVAGELIGSL